MAKPPRTSVAQLQQQLAELQKQIDARKDELVAELLSFIRKLGIIQDENDAEYVRAALRLVADARAGLAPEFDALIKAKGLNLSAALGGRLGKPAKAGSTVGAPVGEANGAHVDPGSQSTNP